MHGRQQGVKSPPVSKARDQHADEEERGLIQRLTAGDHEAFETLFQRYFTTVYRQAMRLSGQQAEAEEVVQEVFLTVYEKAHTFRGQSAFSTWLYRITVNAVAPGPTETGILERSGLTASIVEQIKEEETERVPLGRRGTSEEVAAWIVDLANPTASWITGQVIAIDGGLSIA